MQLPNAFVTLLTTPSYLPGALVLLHALNELHPAPRDYKTVCLVTPETVDAKTIGELRKAGWDFVIGVEPIGSGVAGEKGLHMMGRPDLNYALTKLHLFRLHTLFSTLIYLDADVLPLRPLAHLFQTTNPHTLSACPDTGWPDCFNSGVMVIRPKESDWNGLKGLLKNGEGEEGIYLTGDEEAGGNGSFDGADQGLLNEWFSEEGGGGAWNRLPFTYNVTPSAAYTYKPAYHRYGHKINVVHFIGPNKPWANLAGRPAGMSLTKEGKESYDYPALIDRWYDVYDRNVRPTAAHAPDLAHRFAVPEHVAVWNLASGVPAQPQDRLDLDQLRDAVDKGVTALKPGQYMSLPLDGRVDLIMPKPQPKKARSVKFDEPRMESPAAIASPTQYHAPPPQTLQQQTSQPAIWDAVHHAPPREGKPEMSIRMDTFYAPAWEQTPAQQSAYYKQSEEKQPDYPTLPASVTSDTWYKDYSGKVPDKRNIKPVFPWEQPGHSHRAPDRVFPRGSSPPPQPQSSAPRLNVQIPTPPVPPPSIRQPSPPPQPRSMADAMASYTNAWDSMPSIQRYVNRITGRANAPTGLGMARRESTFDPASIQSVPPTPKGEQPEKKVKDHKRDTSIDRHSEASADGDDEDEDSSADESGPSPFIPAAEGKVGQSPASSVNARYQDRFAQTDNSNMADAKVQAVPGGGSSPALKTVELPPSSSSTRRNSATGKRPRNVRNSSSSASASTSDPYRTSSGPLTPTSDSTVTAQTVRRVPFPSGPGMGSASGPYTTSPATTARAFPPTHSAKSSFGGTYGNFSSSNFADAGQPGHGHGRRLSTEARTNEGVPLGWAGGQGQGQSLPQIGERSAGRYFPPETDLDKRKEDTHAVLTRFMKEASVSQTGGLGLK